MRAHRPELRPCHHVPAARGLRSTSSRATSSRRSSGGSCDAGSSVTARPGATAAMQADAELVSFSCNDYLGLSQHPEVVAASVEATRRFGVGAGSSRLVNGNHPLYVELERKLAALKGTEDAVVFGSGYLTNVGVIPALVGRSDLIVLDELCHSSSADGRELERRARARVSPQRRRARGRAARRRARHASPLPRADRRRVQHGRRPGAARDRSRRSRPSTTRGS